MLMRSRGEYAEQNVGVNTKTAGMKEIACMTTSFQMPLQSTPFLWSDAVIASIGNRQEAKLETHFQIWSISEVANLQNIAAVKAISALTGNGKKVLSDAVFLPNQETAETVPRLYGWACKSNSQEQRETV